MGGKDAIVVADDADLDAAVDGVVASAFGFSGQKCSACSRAIVDRRLYDRFVEALRRESKSPRRRRPRRPRRRPGSGHQPKSRRKDCRLHRVGRERRPAGHGRRADCRSRDISSSLPFSPTSPPGSRLAQEEIFGPVLAVIRADDFEYALAIANETEFGLTGAVYTRDPQRIEQARDEFFVGNLYINRKCTGALVGVHPFGGFNMSGTDSKAGGYDYLLLFVQAQSIAQSRP